MHRRLPPGDRIGLLPRSGLAGQPDGGGAPCMRGGVCRIRLTAAMSRCVMLPPAVCASPYGPRRFVLARAAQPA